MAYILHHRHDKYQRVLAPASGAASAPQPAAASCTITRRIHVVIANLVFAVMGITIGLAVTVFYSGLSIALLGVCSLRLEFCCHTFASLKPGWRGRHRTTLCKRGCQSPADPQSYRMTRSSRRTSGSFAKIKAFVPMQPWLPHDDKDDNPGPE